MKKKRIKIFTFALIILFFLTLPLSKPSPETFNKWLANKYDTECIGDECEFKSSQEKVVHRTIDDYILINKMGIILEDEEGRRTLIEGIGIFGTFIPFTFNPGYSPLIDIYKY
ncbi:hypothetical protein E1I69_14440 [Bacillus timonensis]|uniref:DUF4359 domain-containing protein n=1 Tax=Bacillus timonensis TaxID=1033734 RepID=A0A4S3PQN3_9BACI|nr:hypothetical protein [Bacillus timonensis]THE11644.1 hypothetical protein E1I69_14440 [Bacillus timonensis]